MIPKSGDRFSDEIMRDAKRQRIDKWLWHARMVRSRSDAAALVQAGYVRINAVKVAAHGHPVRLGDVITLSLDRSVRLLRVENFSDKRGNPAAARKLYLDLGKETGAKTGRQPAP